MLAEQSKAPRETSLALYAKTFTANEFIEWAMTQPEVRDQCDALFIGSELLCRAVFAPVSCSRADALYAPTLRPGNGVYRLVAKKKAERNRHSSARQSRRDHERGRARRVERPRRRYRPAERRATGFKLRGFRNRPLSEPKKKKRLRSRGGRRRRASSSIGDPLGWGISPSSREHRQFVMTSSSDGARLAAFKARAAARRRTRALEKAYRRTMHSAYAPARAARGWLGTRLGPHALFATMAPLLLLHLFAEHVVAVVCFAWWCWRHVARADAAAPGPEAARAPRSWPGSRAAAGTPSCTRTAARPRTGGPKCCGRSGTAGSSSALNSALLTRGGTRTCWRG